MKPEVLNVLAKNSRALTTIAGSCVEEEDGKKIYLSVTDNGVGMEKEEVERLQKEITRPCKETVSGFGLANVNERIRMNFGMEYGMTITSEKGKGTTVKVVIPAERMENSAERSAYEVPV